MDTATNNAANDSVSARDKLMRDLKLVIKDAEELLTQTGVQTGEGFKQAKAKFESTLSTAKTELGRLEETVIEKTKDAAYATDKFVKDNPWQSVGLAGVVGLICGLLISRK
ncbi:MAG: DUF883 family protein [Pseudomonadota bacterium]